MNIPDKLGKLPDERTTGAGVDSVLLAQAFWRDDMAAVQRQGHQWNRSEFLRYCPLRPHE